MHEEEAKDGRTGQDITFKYTTYKVAGNGSFGVVYQAKVVGTGESVAIKKVFQDRRFKVSYLRLNDGKRRRRRRQLNTSVCRIENCKLCVVFGILMSLL